MSGNEGLHLIMETLLVKCSEKKEANGDALLEPLVNLENEKLLAPKCETRGNIFSPFFSLFFFLVSSSLSCLL